MSTLITVTGNLAADPELRYTGKGKAVSNFTVMTSRRVQQGDDWVDMDTTGWRVTAWDVMAEHVAESLRKGDPVIVQGWAAEKTWETDGQTNRRIELTARNVGFDLRNRPMPSVEAADDVPVRPASSGRPLAEEDFPF